MMSVSIGKGLEEIQGDQIEATGRFSELCLRELLQTEGSQNAPSEGIQHKMEPDFVVWRKECVGFSLSIRWEEVKAAAPPPTRQCTCHLLEEMETASSTAALGMEALARGFCMTSQTEHDCFLKQRGYKFSVELGENSSRLKYRTDVSVHDLLIIKNNHKISQL